MYYYCTFFGIISPAIFEEFFLDWFNNFLYDKDNKESIIAIDGKTVCGSKNKSKSALHILHAYATETGLLLGYKKTNERSNEIIVLVSTLNG